MVCSGWLKNESIRLRLWRSSKCCAASQCNGLRFDKDLIKKIVYNPESNRCTMHRCESCPGTATLKEGLDQELNEHEDH